MCAENNRDSPPGTIDLHGLYVKEAIERTEGAISSAQQRGDQELRVIVGKGLHSQGHVAKIKPAVEDLMRRCVLLTILQHCQERSTRTSGAGKGGRGWEERKMGYLRRGFVSHTKEESGDIVGSGTCRLPPDQQR